MTNLRWLAPALLFSCLGLPAQGFREVAKELGLDAIPAKRATWFDANGDGWPDLLADGCRVFLSTPGPDGKRLFQEVADAIPETIKAWRPTSLPADVDGDGILDLFCGVTCDFQRPKTDARGRPIRDEQGAVVMAVPDDGRRSAILLGDGKGRFRPLEKSGVEQPPGNMIAAAFLDYDRDGRLDLFVGHAYTGNGTGLESYPDRLYRGLGKGRFEDVTEKAGLLGDERPGTRRSRKPTYGVATADWNDDGWTDLLVCTYGRQWNALWKNKSDGSFADMGAETGWDGDEIRHGKYPGGGRRDEPEFRANGNTFDVAVGDIDNDGDLDLFSAEITHYWAGDSSDMSMFLINLGRGEEWRFVRRPGLVPPRHSFPLKPGDPKWNQGDLHSALLDYDNDGWLDLVIASSDYPDDQFLRFYRNLEGKGFEEATGKLKIRWRSPGGISVSDFDRDGRLDLACGRSHMRLTDEQKAESPAVLGLWRNAVDSGNAWLCLRLRGKDGSACVGARVALAAAGMKQVREIQGAAGHACHANDPLVHFGLGKAGRVERVEIRWPGRKSPPTLLENLAVNRYYLVREETGAAEEMK